MFCLYFDCPLNREDFYPKKRLKKKKNKNMVRLTEVVTHLIL